MTFSQHASSLCLFEATSHVVRVMDPRLTALLKHPLLWQTGMARAAQESIPTGFAALDERLPGHGWPTQGLVELLSVVPGRSEMRLLAPALAPWLRENQGWMALVTPPFEPYAPAFASMGLNAERILVLRTSRLTWALEQVMRSGAFRCVLAWPARVHAKSLRRLQLAAEQMSTLLVLNRQVRCRSSPSPAVLRVQLDVTLQGFELDVFKSRGGKAGRVCLSRGDDALSLS